ncbi:VTT domain-containing protein [Gallaecimonas mangrovi]|uniref:VTT domain-containing protein n=1 Tax=Gallaecimonas mangrovi TaxID=2291597 RepID=UPI000E20A006|nr:VTT domain-containing protein [Gallaecimonas mangrovi]
MREIQQLIEQQGLLLVFLNVFLEQLGLPLPAFPLLIVVGAMSMQGLISLPAALALAIIACVLADSLWNLAGRRYGSNLLRTICKLSLSQDSCISSGLGIYASTGPKALLVSRFLPGAGALFTAMAGMHRTSWLRFWAFTGTGALIWASVGLAIGLVFHDAVGSILAELNQYGPIGFAILLAALALFLAYKYLKRQLLVRRTRDVPRITAEELNALSQQGLTPVIIDVRSKLPTLEQGIPGALRVSLSDPIDALVKELSQAPNGVVIYCTCPKEVSAALLAKKLHDHGISGSMALLGGLDAWQQYRLGEQEPSLNAEACS